MSVTIESDVPKETREVVEPCLCAQMAPCWVAVYENKNSSPAEKLELAAEANPKCFECRGTGLENVSHDIASKAMLVLEAIEKGEIKIMWS